jgi:hypothetical protein
MTTKTMLMKNVVLHVVENVIVNMHIAQDVVKKLNWKSGVLNEEKGYMYNTKRTVVTIQVQYCRSLLEHTRNPITTCW